MQELRGRNPFEAGVSWPCICARRMTRRIVAVAPTRAAVAAFAFVVCSMPTFAFAARHECSIRCEIQEIAPSDDRGDRPKQAYIPSRLPAESLAAGYYRRGPDGDWIVPRTVDRNDPRVILLLTAPGEPLLLEISIYVDGKPFRCRREEWIDDALNVSKKDADKSGSGDRTGGDDNAAFVRSRGYQRVEPGKRLMHYARCCGSGLGRDEARWLLAQWSPGPALLILGSGFGAELAGYAPVYAALDTDFDRRLSAEEILAADRALWSRDENEDGVLELGELDRAAAVTPLGDGAWRPAPLITLLDDSTDWIHIRKELKESYGRIPERLRSAAEAGKQTDLSPDIAVSVSFGGPEEKSGLSVTHSNERIRCCVEPSANSPSPEAPRAVKLAIGAISLEISATEDRSAGAADSDSGQVAVGAVVDGCPIFDLLDTDGDRRLSRRETAAIKACLERMDANNDGEISGKEVHTPIRLVVAKGPNVHRVLCSSRSVKPKRDGETQTSPPEWFLGMDKNNDGDLTREEFLGTDGQFRTFDGNGDGWISRREALKSERGQR